MFSEDELKEMEKYAAEMKVVKFAMKFSRDTKPVLAVLQGISRSALIEDLTVGGMYLCMYTCIHYMWVHVRIQFYRSAGICI